MAVACPNKNTEEWKYLEENLGTDGAYRAFIANGDSLPTMEQARDLVRKVSGVQEQREDQQIEDQQEEQETYKRETYKRKRQLLQNSFAKAGITVDIREESIDGAVGYVEPPSSDTENPTVVVDPDKVGGDTLVHEFAHIYIDMLGIDHPMVQKGIDQLRDTEVWNEVAEKYSDLGDESFQKEVLATQMGREGFDKRTKDGKPSKFKVWMRRLFRAIAKIFGVEPDAARVLAEDMWQNKVRSEEFQGEFSEYRQEQREEEQIDDEEPGEDHENFVEMDEFKEKVLDTMTFLQRTIEDSKQKVRALRESYEKEGKEVPQKVLDKEERIVQLEQQRDALNKVEGLEQMSEFFHRIARMVRSADARMDKIAKKEEVKNMDEQDIKELAEVYHLVKEFEIIEEFADEFSPKEQRSETEEDISNTMREILDRSQSIQSRFRNEYIPMHAEYLVRYKSEDVDEEVQQFIDHAKQMKEEFRKGNRNDIRTPGIETSDPTYRQKYDEYKKEKDKLIKKHGKNSSQVKKRNKKWEYEKADEYIQQIKDRKMVNKKNVENMLRHEFTKKSGYSKMIDPTIYSSDTAIQLFAKSVKDELYKANQDSIETSKEVQEAYREYKEAKGLSDDNTEKFNDPIMKNYEVPVYRNEDGEWEWETIRSFVQPYDTEAFWKEYFAFFRNGDNQREALNKRFNRPDPEKVDQETMDAFYKSPQGREYRAAEARWWKENTQAVEGAKERVDKIESYIKYYDGLISSLRKEKAQKEETDYALEERISNLSVLRDKAEREKNALVMKDPDTGTRIYKGSLAKPAEKYRDQKYDQLQKDPAAKKYYDTLLDVYQRSQDKIARRTVKNNPWDEYTYMLPSVRKIDYDRLKEQGLFTAAKDSLSESFQMQSTDTQYGISIDAQGNEVKNVPIFFTQYENAQDVSSDVASSILQFEHMANNYNRRSEIEHRAYLMEELISNRETIDTDSKGSMLMDKTAEKLSSILGTDLRRPSKKKGGAKDNKHAEQLSEFIDNVFYDRKMISQEFSIMGKQFEATKSAGTLSQITAVNTLSFNMLQGINNVMIGRIFGNTEAYGAGVFDWESFQKAGTEYWKQGAALQDLAKIKAETKLGQLIELYDPMQGEVSDKFGKNVTGSKMKKMAKNDPMFFVQKGGEHEMHVRSMIAALMYRKARDKDGNIIKKDDGSEMSLWDAYYVDYNDGNKLKVDERVANLTDRQQKDLMNKVHGVNKRLHGVYNDFDKAMLKRRWWGQLVMLFRGWFPSGIRRRWGHGHGLHVDQEMGTVSEGMYTSFLRLMIESVQNRKLPFSQYKNMTEMEKSNVLRTMGDIGAVMGMFALIYALSPDDDDEEDNSYVENMMLYQAARTRAEMMFYYYPSDFLQIMKSPTATNRTIDNFTEFLTQATEDAATLSVERYERSVGPYEQGTPKITKDFNDLVPAASGVTKAFSPGESAKWFFQ